MPGAWLDLKWKDSTPPFDLWDLEEHDIMRIARNGFDILARGSQEQDRNVTVMGIFGKGIHHPFVFSPFIHQVGWSAPRLPLVRGNERWCSSSGEFRIRLTKPRKHSEYRQESWESRCEDVRATGWQTRFYQILTVQQYWKWIGNLSVPLKHKKPQLAYFWRTCPFIVFYFIPFSNSSIILNIMCTLNTSKMSQGLVLTLMDTIF